MRQILFFAIAALVIAGVMPRVMSQVGNASTDTQPVKRAESAARQQVNNYRTVTVQSDRSGHFQVEGAVAGKLGIFPAPRDYTGRSSTANGIVKVAPVRLPSLEVNGIRVYDVSAIVIPDESLSVNLLGMSFLSRVRRFEMANGRLVMEQ
jgi:aspartyl protease family protein